MKSAFKLTGIIITAVTLFLFNSCKTYPDYLVFNKSDFKGKEIYDTIEALPKRGLYILSLEDPGLLGDFSWNLGIVKIDKNNPMHSIKYETEIKNKSFRISKDYIAFADIHTSEWGWFDIKNGKILDTLPLITKFIDSIKSISPKNIFIREKNGYVEALLNGKIFQRYNYGDFIAKDNPVNYDSLDLGLYKIQKGKLTNISKDPNYYLNKMTAYFLCLIRDTICFLSLTRKKY
ncbi:MAG: hypothetical protein EOP48_07900 [Sphingobacteriales bacterium]|nr:MAG: hypothetical protein EOP48_07900 [Sphingobacteriales bacterium]